jgi:hypothetical protein
VDEVLRSGSWPWQQPSQRLVAAMPRPVTPTATSLPAPTEVATTVAPQPTVSAKTEPSTDTAAASEPSSTEGVSAAPTIAPTDQTTSDDTAPSGPLPLTWQIQDIDTGTKPAIALSSDGTPNVAYMLETMLGFVKNAVLNGDSWDVTTVVEGYFYGPLDIVIGPDDVPHITYHDHQDDSQFRFELGDAVHAYRDPDGEWQVEAAFGQSHYG